MAIAYGTNSGYSGQSLTSVVNSVPTSTANGDLLLWLVVCQANETVATPTGWTLVQSANSGTTASHIRTYVFKRVASSEPGSYTATLSSSGLIAEGCMIRYTGSNLQVDASATGTSVSGTTQTAPTITPTKTPSYVVGFFGILSQSTNDPTQSTPTGFSQRAAGTFYTSGGAIVDKSYTGTSATGTYTETAGVASVGAAVTLNIFEGDVTVSPPVAGTTTHTGYAPSITTTGSVTISAPVSATTTYTSYVPTVGTAWVVNVPSPGTVAVAAGTVYELYFGVINQDAPTWYWHMDDASGTTMAAQSGGVNGTYSGSFTLNQAGVLPDNPAVTFAAGGKSLISSAPADVNWLSNIAYPNISWEFWVKTSRLENILLGTSSAAAGGREFWWISTSAGYLRFLTDNSSPSTVAQEDASGGYISDGNWHYVVITKATDAFHGYVDGVQTFTHSFNHNHYMTAQADSKTYIGYSDANVSAGFVGKIDELAVYPRTLSAGDVLTHWYFSQYPRSTTVVVPSPGTLSLAGYAPTVSPGGNPTIAAPSANVTFNGVPPNLGANGGIVFSVPVGATTYAGISPSIFGGGNPTVLVTPGGSTYAAFSPTIQLQLQLFKFIDESYTGFTALDAGALTGLDFQAMAHGESKVLRFRVGNIGSVESSFTFSAESLNAGVPDMVRFSTDGQTWVPILTIEGIDANRVTDVVWVQLTVAASAKLSLGTFLLRVVQFAE